MNFFEQYEDNRELNYEFPEEDLFNTKELFGDDEDFIYNEQSLTAMKSDDFE